MELAAVQLGLMLPGGVAFDDKNLNPTWKSPILTNDNGVVTAFVKALPPRKLFVECACALIGQSLGLPIPQPMIVKVTHDSLPDLLKPDDEYYAFASIDVGYPSFRRPISQDSQLAMDKLMAFKKTVDIGLFDEWIANYDRNIGNILYDGGEDFFFIDHELAIPENLPSSQPASRNELLNQYAKKSEFERYKISKSCKENTTAQYSKVPLPLLSEKAYASSYITESADILSIINFLTERIHNLSELVSHRLNLPGNAQSVLLL